MRIYIASSWRNQHAVEMLTDLLRQQGHEVLSFVENNYGEGHGAEKPINFEEWVRTDQAGRSFEYDTKGATESDMVVYVGPSGTDAWAEVGAAWSRGVPILGLWAKGEQAGLMRRMVDCWCDDFRELLKAVGDHAVGVNREKRLATRGGHPYWCFACDRWLVSPGERCPGAATPSREVLRSDQTEPGAEIQPRLAVPTDRAGLFDA